MNYHDWHLAGYSVSDYGTRIALHLSWDYPSEEKKQNDIQFTDVAAYHFTHSGGAIITDIDERPIGDYTEYESEFIQTTHTQMGLRYFQKDLATYLNYLQKEAFRYWTIGSAIGFSGFIVAKNIEET